MPALFPLTYWEVKVSNQNNNSGSNQINHQLGGEHHEHPLLPKEYGHPVTVTNADIPAGLTTENVAVIEMRGARFRTLDDNDFPLSNWVDAFSEVKDRYGDCFDFVVFFTDPRLPDIPYGGYHRGVYNEVEGINRGIYNRRNTWNSQRLQSQLWMGRFSLGTLLQEIGHRWGSFVRYRENAGSPLQSDLMLPGGGHWAREFDDGNSPMDYDEERHIQISNTRWLREPIGGLEFRFCNLDLYLIFEIDPQRAESLKKQEAVWLISAFSIFPNDRLDKENSITSISITSRKFSTRLNNFIIDLNNFREHYKKT